MRTLQLVLGSLFLAAGILGLLGVTGVLVLTASDLAAVALLFSGFLFCIAGLVWRRSIPWLTSLFIPGMLAFAAGVVLLYTGRVGLAQGWYSLTLFAVALGIAFLAMYYLGPRAPWLRDVGLIIGAIGLFFFALFSSVFGPAAAWRILGAVLLIGLGLAVALRPVLSGRLRRGVSAAR